jgi:NTP pyrophosphatase (non-canonical NTP hydrolase)
MNFYEIFVEKMCKPYTDINYCIIALNGEAGEVAEWYKKHTLRGNPTGKLSPEDLKSELGDVLFYLTRLAQLHGWTLKDIMLSNVEKLEQRIAEGKKSIA